MGARRVYRRETPYASNVLGTIDWTQTADIMYTVQLGTPPQRVTRFGHTDWRWNEVVFGPLQSPPTGMTATPTTPNTTGIHTQDYYYVITGITDNGVDPVQETRASAVFSATNDLSLAGNFNTINLPALGAFTRYVIYKKQAGVFGYVGNTNEATFRDENLIPVLSETPPEGYNPFTGITKYPSSVCFHQQRLTFGGTQDVINGVFMSRSADFENMDKARPVRADDSLLFSLVSNEVNAITHILSLKELIILTGDGLWAVGGGGDTGAAITPSSLNASRETGRGAWRVKPLVVDDIMFYVTGKGRAIRTLGFTFEIDGYKSDNVSIFAPHLFTSGVSRIVYLEEPNAGVYALRPDGTIIVLTWEIDQEVWGWARLEIDGYVEDICAIGEGGYDRLYAVIRRTFGEGEDAVTVRNLERMALPGDITNSCHLDMSTTVIFDTPNTVVDGLWHLEGQEVSAVYDAGEADAYIHITTVMQGQIEVPQPSNQISVGLRYSGMIETLPPALGGGQGSMHVERQRVDDVVIRTVQTKGIKAGINGQPLQQIEPEDGDDVSLTADYTMVDHYINVPGSWDDTSSVIIQQDDPFPAQIVGIFVGMTVNP